MPASIEERIVQMRFDNGQFEKGAEQSMRTLDKLEGVLDKLGSGGGLDHITSALDTVEARFSAFGVAGMAAIEKITNSVINLGSKILTAIPNQIISGGWTRAANIEQAQFQLKGLGVAWNEVSDAIDFAVKDTAYGMDEAAMAASQFAASFKPEFWQNATQQVRGSSEAVSQMAVSLRAISGVAGMTNSSYSEIANIFTTVAGQGKLMTMQLRQLEMRGLNVAATLAERLRDGAKNIQYTEEQIREMVTKGEIDFYTFAMAMDDAFGEHAKDANSTFTGALANMKAALSRIGADFATPIRKAGIEIFNAFRLAFNRVRTITKPFAEHIFAGWMERLSPLVKNIADSMNFDWLRGIIAMLSNLNIRPIENMLKGIARINEGIHSLFEYKKEFEDDTDGNGQFWIFNEKAQQRVENLKKALSGLQALGKIIGTVLTFIGSRIRRLFSTSGLGLFDGFLDLIGKTGEKLDKLQKKITHSQGITSMFMKLDRLMEPVSRGLKAIADIAKMAFSAIGQGLRNVFPSLRSFLDHFGGGLYQALLKGATGLADWLEKIRDSISEHTTFQTIVEGISNAFTTISNAIQTAASAVSDFFRKLMGLEEGESVWQGIGNMFQKAGEKIAEVFGKIREALSETFSKNGFTTGVVKMAGTLISALVAWRKLESVKFKVKNFTRAIKALFGNFEGLANIPAKIESVLSRTSGAIRAFGDNLNAKSLFILAGAIVTLALGLGILASIDENRLGTSLGAVTALLTALVAAFAAIHYIMQPKMLSTKVDAVNTVFGKFFNKVATKAKQFGVDLGNIFKGIFKSLSTYLESKSILNIAKAIFFLGLSVLTLAAAVWVLSKVDPDRLVKSIVAVISLLAFMTAALYVLSKWGKSMNMAAAGAAFVGMALGLVMLSAALVVLSFIPWKKLYTALGALILLVATLTIALKVLSSGELKNYGDLLAAGFAFLMIAAALMVLSAALLVLAFVPWKKLAVGLGAMLIAVVVFVAALRIMSGESFNPVNMIAGAFAMVLMASAMVILAAALAVLAFIPWKKLVTAAVVLGFLMAVMAAVMYVLADIAPLALVASAAFLILAAGLALVAAAIAIAAFGLIELAVALNMLKGFTFSELRDIGKGLKEIGKGMTRLGIGAVLMSVGKDAFASMIPLAAALAAMEDLDMNTIGPRLKKIGRGLQALGLGGLSMALGRLGLLAGIPALSALSGVLPGLAEGIQAFSVIDPGTLVKSFVALAEGVGALIGLNFVSGAVPVELLGQLGPSLIALAPGVEAIGAVTFVGIGKTFVALAEGIGALIGLNFVGGDVPIEMIGLLGPALTAFAPGIAAVGNVAFADLGKTFMALAEGVGALIALDFVNSSVDPVIFGELGAALVAFAPGITAIGAVTIADLAGTFVALAEGVGALIALDFVNSSVDPSIFGQLGTALVAFAPGITAIGAATISDLAGTFVALAEGVGALIALDFVNSSVNPTILGDLGAALIALAPGITAIGGVTITDLGDMLGALAIGIGSLLFMQKTDAEAIDMTLLTGLGDALPKLADGIRAFDGVTFGNLASAAGAILELKAINTTNANNLSLTGTGMKNLADGLAALPENAKTILDNLTDGIRKNKGLPATEIQNCASGIVTAFQAYEGSWVTLGGNISIGIANGIYQNAYLAVNAASTVARWIQNAFTSANQIESPSKVFAGYGGYMMAGLAQGIQNGTDVVTESMIVAITPAIAALQNLMNGDFSIAPTIRPVLDLANVSNAASSVGSMFGNTSISANVARTAERVGAVSDAAAGVTNNTTVTGDTFVVNVYPSEGMDEEAIADAVMARMATRMTRRGVAFG